ncbi:MAG: replication-associated recombination protein A [Candidatus Parcubacteria bacterium]|nr:replication-associated recombination protein A [Candidatus Parcubacteria bacterium]
MDLFDKNLREAAPLADRMRPVDFSDFMGQEQIVGPKTLLRQAIEADNLPSIIFWGPPGTGKTTLAKIIAQKTSAFFEPFSAVSSGVKELRDVIKAAIERKKFKNQKTILFIDEIHRWNKSQQDALLPYVEKGIVTLIGATTENPSFEVNSALLSRCRVFVLNLLEQDQLKQIIKNAVNDKERGFGNLKVEIGEDVQDHLTQMSNGDARTVLNALEFSVNSTKPNKDSKIVLDKKIIEQALQKSYLYDKAGEQHYNIISALHKSMRGSDANAALYWLGRMVESGEDPLYIARRLVRFASEDIGLADPNALVQTVSAYTACHYLGYPECDVILAQAVAYLAKAPKSNKLYLAIGQVKQDIKNLPNEPVPLHLRNAPTKLMQDLNYGKDYKYTPNFKNAEDAKQDYLPEKLKNRKYLESN